jgi:hypothetical protein
MQDYLLDTCNTEDNTNLQSKAEGSMSVCIAGICWTDSASKDAERRIVAVADMKSSGTQGSNELASSKVQWILPTWLALFAGNDIAPCLPIVRDVKRRLTDKPNTVDNITGAFVAAYKNHLADLATDKVLGRWKLSMEEFEESGRKKFGADNFDVLFSQIMEVRLQCQFLVCGFDETKDAHIFTVRNPGVADNYDVPGYFAIGDGAAAAMSILGFFAQNIHASLPRTYYNVFAAKYMAESSASTVGHNTFAQEIGPRGVEGKVYQLFSLLQCTRDAWAEGKPSRPDGIEEEIKRLRFAPLPSESEKSESEQ